MLHAFNNLFNINYAFNLYSKSFILLEASRGAVAQSVTIKPTGCGFDPHSRR